jgi:hypothetical protein
MTIRMVFHLPLRQTEGFLRFRAGLLQVDNPLTSLSADGAYDMAGVYEAAQSKGGGRTVRMLIPPGRDAPLAPKPSAALQERNRNIHSIHELGRRE